MDIYLIRHGDWDSTTLSDRGVAQINSTAQFLSGLDLNSQKTALLTSDMERAVQSGEIIKKVLGIESVQICLWLVNGDIVAEFEHFSMDNPSINNILAVSHMPDIAATLNFYGRAWGRNSRLIINNGDVFLIDFQNQSVDKIFTP